MFTLPILGTLGKGSYDYGFVVSVDREPTGGVESPPLVESPVEPPDNVASPTTTPESVGVSFESSSDPQLMRTVDPTRASAAMA
jgi:hypothetical protein